MGLVPTFGIPTSLFFHGEVLAEGTCIQICTQFEIPLAVSDRISSSTEKGGQILKN
jgi:hypothetical protein